MRSLLDQKISAVCAVTLYCAGAVSTGSAAPILSLEPKSVTESERASIPVVGAYVAGAAYISSVQSHERPSLVAHIPKAWAGKSVCARSVSVDGIYEGTYLYEVPSTWSGTGTISLEYPTKYRDRLGQAGLGEVGVTLALGDCTTKSKEIAPVFWNSVETPEKTAVVVMINSVGATEVFLFLGESAEAEPIDCTKLNVEIAKEFDFKCVLPTEQLRGPRTKIEINARVSGVLDPPRIVHLEMAQ